MKEKRSRDEDEKAEIDYGNAYTAIFKPTSEKQVRRYIRLFKGPEIVRRTNPFKQKYVGWLESQITFIRTVPNYELVDTPRAPTWGAPKSTMILAETMAEIFFTPEGATGGIIIGSDRVVPDTRLLLIDRYVDAAEAQHNPINRYSRENVSAFEKYAEEIKKAIKKHAATPEAREEAKAEAKAAAKAKAKAKAKV